MKNIWRQTKRAVLAIALSLGAVSGCGEVPEQAGEGSAEEAPKESASIFFNECTPNNPCQHGGTCEEQVLSYLCTCPAGTSGTNCEIGFPTNPPGRGLYEPCSSSTECSTDAGVCLFGYCTRICTADSECGTTAVGSSAITKCEKARGWDHPAQCMVTHCSLNSDCPAGLACRPTFSGATNYCGTPVN